MTDEKRREAPAEADRKDDRDLVDTGSDLSFPASDPPSYMGGTAVAGPPPADHASHGRVSEDLAEEDAAKPGSDGKTKPANG